jgi:hypothetical protein
VSGKPDYHASHQSPSQQPFLLVAASCQQCHQVAEQCAMLQPHHATCAGLCCVHLQVSGRVPTSQTTLLPMHDL